MKRFDPSPITSARRLYLLRALVTLLGTGLPATRAYALVTEEAGDEGWLQADAVTECLLAAGRSDATPGSPIDLAVRRLEVEARVADTLRCTARRLATLALMGVLAAGGLLIWWIPQLQAIYHSMNIELPAFTKLLLKAGEVAAIAGPVFVFPLGALALLLALVALGQCGPYLPGVRTVIRRWRDVQLRRDLGTLLAAHVPPARTLDALARRARTVGNAAQAATLASAATFVLKGAALSTALERAHADPQLIHLVSSGEEAGSIERVMLVAAALGERRFVETLSRWLSGLIPALGFLGLVAGTLVVLSLFMPMLGLCNCVG